MRKQNKKHFITLSVSLKIHYKKRFEFDVFETEKKAGAVMLCLASDGREFLSYENLH